MRISLIFSIFKIANKLVHFQDETPSSNESMNITGHQPLLILRKKNWMNLWVSVLFIYEALLMGGDNLLIIGWLLYYPICLWLRFYFHFIFLNSCWKLSQHNSHKFHLLPSPTFKFNLILHVVFILIFPLSPSAACISHDFRMSCRQFCCSSLA